MRATPLSAVLLVTRSLATDRWNSQYNGLSDQVSGSFFRKSMFKDRASTNFYVFLVMKSGISFTRMSWSERVIRFYGFSEIGDVSNLNTVFLFSSTEIESSKKEKPISSSERYQKCPLSFFRAAREIMSPETSKRRDKRRSFFGADIPRRDENQLLM